VWRDQYHAVGGTDTGRARRHHDIVAPAAKRRRPPPRPEDVARNRADRVRGHETGGWIALPRWPLEF
jgi:hypothetical protein